MPLSKDYPQDFPGRRFIGLPDNVLVRTNQHQSDVMKRELSSTLCPAFANKQRRRLEQLYLLPPPWAQEMAQEKDSLASLTMGRSISSSNAFVGYHPLGLQDECARQGEFARLSSRSISLSPSDRSLPTASEKHSTPNISDFQQECSSRGGKNHISHSASVPDVLSLDRHRRKMTPSRSDGRPGLEQFYNFDTMHKRSIPGRNNASPGLAEQSETACHRKAQTAERRTARG